MHTEDRAAGTSRPGLWLGLILVITCLLYATHMRLSQESLWLDDPERYMAGDVPVMTTLDAYYSLRLARLQASGEFMPHGAVPQRHYHRPEQHDRDSWYEQREPKSLPLLSRVIAAAAPAFGGSIDRAALMLPAWLASLFMLPLFIYFWRQGLPAAGLLGGLTATFALDYYYRTTLGWADTDALNLFFPWMVSCLIACMHAGQSRQTLAILSAAAGVCLLLYHQWYSKPAMTLAYVLVLGAHLRLAGVRGRTLALCMGLMVLCANPLQFSELAGNLMSFVRRYIIPMPEPGGGLQLPQVWHTIGETRALSASEQLRRITGSAPVAAIGLAGFIALAVRRWRSMLPLVPLILLAAMALLSARRFVLYLAPFVGIGWGYLLWLPVRRLWAEPRAAVITCLASLALYAALIAPKVVGRVQPVPAIHGQVVTQLQRLKSELPADARLWTWWDLGFALVDITGLGVYHDGSTQYTPQTNLIATSLMQSDQQTMHEIIRYVDREGNLGLRGLLSASSDRSELLAKVRAAAGAMGSTPIYVLFTPDMLSKYEAIRWMAGTAPGVKPTHTARPGIDWIPCQTLVGDLLHCAGGTIDLAQGVMRGGVAAERQLRRTLVIENGRVQTERTFERPDGLTLQLVVESGRIGAAYLLDEAAFQSNLNQMYLLQRFDAARFSPSVDAFPYVRAYRVLP